MRKTTMPWIHRFSSILVSFTFILLSLCHVHASTTDGKNLKGVRERVDQYMEARMRGDFKEAYDYFHQTYKDAVSRETFIIKSSRSPSYKGYRIEGVEGDPSSGEAVVRLRIDISFKGFDFKDAPQDQHWVFDEEEWFLKVDPKPKSAVPDK